MPFTRRANGSQAQNLIQASWFNDFMDALTGVMADQPVTINNTLLLKQISYTAPAAPALALASGTGLGTGAYTYAITYGMGFGQTLPGTTATITTTSGNNKVNLSNIPLGPAGTTYRAIYRSKVGTSTPLYAVHTINDNTTTTYADTTPDSSLVSVASTHDKFGGYLVIQNSSGTNVTELFPDGAVKFDTGKIISDGFGNLTVNTGGSLTVNGALTVNSATSSLATTNLYGTLTLTGTNNLVVGGSSTLNSLSVTNAASVGGNIDVGGGKMTSQGAAIVDASGFDTFIQSRGSGNVMHFKGNGSTGGDWLSVQGGGISIMPNNGSTPSYIQVGVGLGVKKTSGTKLMEAKADGTFVIGGATYYTNQTTAGYSANGAFDGFDFSEVFQVDAEYPAGTIVCPADTTTAIAYDGTPQSGIPLMTKCTHDACNLAGIIVTVPAFCAGAPNVPSMPDYDSTQPMKQPVAMSGRVFAKTANDIAPRSYVTPDGRGGVRQVLAGEKVMSLGVAITPTSSGMVPLLIRPTFVTL